MIKTATDKATVLFGAIITSVSLLDHFMFSRYFTDKILSFLTSESSTIAQIAGTSQIFLLFTPMHVVQYMTYFFMAKTAFGVLAMQSGIFKKDEVAARLRDKTRSSNNDFIKNFCDKASNVIFLIKTSPLVFMIEDYYKYVTISNLLAYNRRMGFSDIIKIVTLNNVAVPKPPGVYNIPVSPGELNAFDEQMMTLLPMIGIGLHMFRDVLTKMFGYDIFRTTKLKPDAPLIDIIVNQIKTYIQVGLGAPGISFSDSVGTMAHLIIYDFFNSAYAGVQHIMTRAGEDYRQNARDRRILNIREHRKMIASLFVNEIYRIIFFEQTKNEWVNEKTSSSSSKKESDTDENPTGIMAYGFYDRIRTDIIKSGVLSQDLGNLIINALQEVISEEDMNGKKSDFYRRNNKDAPYSSKHVVFLDKNDSKIGRASCRERV